MRTLIFSRARDNDFARFVVALALPLYIAIGDKLGDVSRMTPITRRKYWIGNIAKSRIIDEVLATAPGPKPVTVFDYGCGDGGDWPDILRDYPHIRLVCYEPNPLSLAKAKNRLSGYPVQLTTGDEIEALRCEANFIVSFSVFEHVVDRKQFLEYAKRNLSREGIFFLNYDDGHFRNFLDLADLNTWSEAVRSFIRTIISRPIAAIGHTSRFQRRVFAIDADRLVANAGFKILGKDYHNLTCLKDLSKSIPPDQSQEFASWWLDTELVLNRRFKFELAAAKYGDKVNLWRHMPTRTLRLANA